MVIHIVRLPRPVFGCKYRPKLTDSPVLLFTYQNIGPRKFWQCQTKENRDYHAAKSVPEISTIQWLSDPMTLSNVAVKTVADGFLFLHPDALRKTVQQRSVVMQMKHLCVRVKHREERRAINKNNGSKNS